MSPLRVDLQHVQQPPKSRICGQACLAMLLGISLEKAIELVGHKHGTKTAELAKILRSKHVLCGSRLVPFRGRYPRDFRGLAKVRRGGGGWHWVVLWNEEVYDPLRSQPCNLSSYLLTLPSGKTLSSGLNTDLGEL